MILGPDGKVLQISSRKRRDNPTRGLAPSDLERQLTSFARGHLRPLAETMDWVMEHDDICSAVSFTAKTSVTDQGWEISQKSEARKGSEVMAQKQEDLVQGLFDELEARDSTDEDEEGGVNLLLDQMMLAYGQRYSMHHLVWRSTRFGRRLTTHFVPLCNFENSTGRMTFVEPKGWAGSGAGYRSTNRGAGQGVGIPLSQIGGANAWMLTKGRGVMLAGVIAWMFKHLPLGDWLTYCDRHGMPAFLGKSDAQAGDPEWEEMARAVYSLAAEYAAVVSNKNGIEVLDLKGSGETPYPALVDRMDRAMAILWRGSDLATMSRGSAVGASVQIDSTKSLDRRNASWLSETINRRLVRPLLEAEFGEGVPALVEFKVRVPSKDTRKDDLAVVEGLAKRGLKIGTSWIRKEFSIPEPEEGEEVLKVGESKEDAEAAQDLRALNAALNNQPANSPSPKLIEDSLAKIIGVTVENFAGLDAWFADLEKAAADDSGADFLGAASDLASQIPELLSVQDLLPIVEAAEAAMGGAVLQGIRSAIREDAEKSKK